MGLILLMYVDRRVNQNWPRGVLCSQDLLSPSWTTFSASMIADKLNQAEICLSLVN